MDPSSGQHHHQELSSQTLESMLVSTKPQQQDFKKPRPAEQLPINCPRCDSTNTKFCYYNNYSLSQPRYFCKSCRRYWTKGGTLRNVPVGGGCRKNKRSSSSSKSTSQDHSINTSPNNPISSLTQMSYDSSDLTLAFASLQKQTSGHLGIHENHNISMMCNGNTGTSADFLESIRGGSFLQNQNGFHHQNLYYGIGSNGDIGNVENDGNYMGVNVSEEMGNMHYDQEISSGATTTTATAVTTVKQEMCNMAREGHNDNRVLWGFPWQINGDGNNTMGDFDSSRRIWNGVGGPSWHGLLNSPLM